MTPHTNPTLDALDELVEVFVGLSNELEWATSEDISRKELLPIMEMCASGTLKPAQAVEVVCSNVKVKRDHLFEVMLGISKRLNKQLAGYDLVEKSQTGNPNPVSGEAGDEAV